MKREELLKLPKGKYLVTDDICNYKYVLVIYEKQKDSNMIGYLYDYHYYCGSPFTSHVSIFYSDEDIEIDYQTIEIKRLTGSCRMGGIYAHFDFGRALYELRMVGIYNKETIKEDMEKFKINHWVNLRIYDKKRGRKSKLKKN